MKKKYFSENEFLPVFPLPNTILFPGVSIPLHIFEPRYRQMINDILDKKGVFCLATISENWNGEHDGDFEFHETGTICHLQQYTPMQDGRFNIVVEGLARATLTQPTFMNGKKYRSVKIDRVIADWSCDVNGNKIEEIRRIAFNFFKTIPSSSSEEEILTHFAKLKLVQLTNILCMNSPCSMTEKHAMFELDSLEHVCDALLGYFQSYRTQ